MIKKALDTNLKDSSSYYEVTQSFDIFHITGFEPSNSYYGSSQIYKPVFKKVKANIGDMIYNIPGGLFHVVKGKTTAMPFDTEEREFSAFEKRRNYYKFDLSKLKEIERPEVKVNYKNIASLKQITKIAKEIIDLKQDRLTIGGFRKMLKMNATNTDVEIEAFLDQTDPDNKNFKNENMQYGLGRLTSVAEQGIKTYNGFLKVVKDLSKEY